MASISSSEALKLTNALLDHRRGILQLNVYEVMPLISQIDPQKNHNPDLRIVAAQEADRLYELTITQVLENSENGTGLFSYADLFFSKPNRGIRDLLTESYRKGNPHSLKCIMTTTEDHEEDLDKVFRIERPILAIPNINQIEGGLSKLLKWEEKHTEYKEKVGGSDSFRKIKPEAYTQFWEKTLEHDTD